MKTATKKSVPALKTPSTQKSKSVKLDVDSSDDDDEYDYSPRGKVQPTSKPTQQPQKSKSVTSKSQPKEDAKSLETDMFGVIAEFTQFVSAITSELEGLEQDALAAAEENGEDPPEILWADSTFKIDLISGLLTNVFSTKKERMLKYYVCILLPMKKWIVKRKEKFFIKANIFPGVPEHDVKFFRDLWSVEGTMTEEEKNIAWQFFDAQIEIAEKWQAVTGWKYDPAEKLEIPNVDFAKAAAEAGITDSEDDEAE